MKKNLLLFLCLGIFFACTKEDIETTQQITKEDLLGSWELLYPINSSRYNESGDLIFQGDLYLPHTFTADGRFTIEETSFHTRVEKGDFEVDSLLGEIRFFSDPHYVDLDGIEVELLDSYHFKTWVVQSMEDDQLFVKERNWFMDLDGEITESDDILSRVFVKVD